MVVPGLQALNHDAAVFVGDILSVALAYHGARAVCHQEGNALQGSRGAFDVLLDHEGSAGGVVERKRLRVVGIDHHSLRLSSGVNGIAGDGLGFRDHQCAHHAVDLDLAVLVRHIQAVAGDIAIFIGDEFSGGSSYFERNALQRLSGQRIPLVDNKGACFGIFDDHSLGIAVLANDYIGRGGVHNVPRRTLDLRDDICPGGQVGDVDLACRISDKDAVLGKSAVSDHPIQANFAASGGGHAEFSAGKGLAGGAVPLLDDQLSLGLVLKGQADGAPLLDLDGLRLGINEVARRGRGFGDDHAFPGFRPSMRISPFSSVR